MADHPETTSSTATRVLGIASLASIVVLVIYAFAVTGPDVRLGETVRIMYVHVPTVSIAYLFMLANAVCSVMFLVKRSSFFDVAAGASGEIGVVLLGLTLVTGMLWGRPTWGAYWVWDARLTTTALLFLMYVGYLTMRTLPGNPNVRAVRAAVVGIVSAALIYPVHMSVEWWSSLHQGRTVFGRATKAAIAGDQETALYIGFLAFLLVASWLAVHRFRVGWLADRAAGVEIDAAVAARRAEHEPAVSSPGQVKP